MAHAELIEKHIDLPLVLRVPEEQSLVPVQRVELTVRLIPEFAEQALDCPLLRRQAHEICVTIRTLQRTVRRAG
ncbi:hypothetical protein HRbin27_01492 [bacterium HR27]|nr:hypothetical protein HRbin27_01492 [bacterium HR27]